MYVVAITELATPPDVEAAALAPEIGVTPYEARLELAGGVPAIVLTTPDRARASRLAEAIRARRHGVVAIDTSAVVPNEEMIGMRRFRLAEGAIVAEDRNVELAYDDVFVLIRAQHRHETERTEHVKTLTVSGARAILTGGLLMTKNVKAEVRVAVEEREQVLYLYRRSGGTPWILHEAQTSYAGLGTAILPSQLENFNRTVRELRERMPLADYDDRLLSMRRVRSALSSAVGLGSVTHSSAAWIDLLAHVLALAIFRRKSDPYRT
jgi:hypothetical protein